jgi:hypothetical protein
VVDILTQEDLTTIDRQLAEGLSPEQIAKSRGMTRARLIFQLLKAGKEIVISRKLQDTGCAPPSAVVGDAAATVASR